MTVKRKPNIAQSLLKSSKSAMISAIEIHNKPYFNYRYETCAILIINAWELLLKAYIYKNEGRKSLFPYKKELKKQSISLDDAITRIFTQLEKEFLPIQESILRISDYRNDFIHFFGDSLDPILFSLVQQNIYFYVKFLKTFFNDDIVSQINLQLLPIGFEPINPIDFIYSTNDSIRNSSKEVKKFLQSIVTSTENLIDNNVDEPILSQYNIHLINQLSSKNADIYARWANDDETINNLVIKKDLKLKYDPNGKSTNFEEYWKLSPKDVCEKVCEKLNWPSENILKTKDEKKTCKFKENPHHRRAIILYGSIVEKRQKNKGEWQTEKKYCGYSEAAKDIRYSQEWVDFLCEKLSIEDEYEQIINWQNTVSHYTQSTNL